MESFGLLRTNPNLTTNVKVVLSNDVLYFESFDSSSSLGDDRYKKRIIPQNSFYNVELINYWRDTPIDVAFNQKNLEDFNIIYSKYDDQIDDTYLSGGGNVEDTNYPEEFEYLAPVHIYPGNLPNDFIIFRVDGSGLINLTSENFRSEILDKMKVVTRFDLSPKTKLGKFLDNSFNQSDLPNSSIEVDFSLNEFTYWNGVDYKTGQYVRKSKIMDSEFSREMTFTQGYDLLTRGFKEEGVIYPYIINLKFLFDDTPATPDRLMKWSINRYYGYYGNLEEIGKITPYNSPSLKSGLKLTDNNIFTLDGNPVDPFERGYKTNRIYYIEYLSDFYLISKIDSNTFKVISDIVLPKDVDQNFNTNTIYFSDGTNDNEIISLNRNPFELNDTSDIIIIEIDGEYHRLLYNTDTSKWYVLSDYKFVVSNNIFRYYINKNDPNYTTVLNLNNVDINNPPMSFKIYRYNFSDIKDFDLDILDTEFSKFEYEFDEDITDTQEPKLYESDLNFNGSSKPTQKYLYKNKVVSIPVSSEFVGTGELFEIIGKENSHPNKFWVKNPRIVKWGIEGSLSNNDYPYIFNINSNADDYNRTTNTEKLIPNRPSRNMDYFYTISSDSYKFGYTNPVIHQSLSIINNEPFDISKYFNIGYDSNYFDEIFGQNETDLNGVITPRRKYSYFTKGDQMTPNQSLIKGINVSLYDVNNILTNITNGKKTIRSLNVKGTNNFENYKMSILLSELSEDPSSEFTKIDNNSDWAMITKWQKNKEYNTGDIVLFNGSEFKDSNGQFGFSGYGTESGTGSIIPSEYTYPDGTTEPLEIDPNTHELLTVVPASGPNNGTSQLFECISDTIIDDPSLTLTDDPNWGSYPTGYRTIFYKTNLSYLAWDQIGASYSYLMDGSGVNINYLNYFIYYNEEYYKCVKDQTSTDNRNPNYVGISIINGLQVPYWEKVEEYITTKNYTSDEIVTMDNNLYYFDITDQKLSIIHTFDPIAKTPYNIYSIVNFNDNLYIDRVGNSSLDNGINIYINKKWNNVLINIYFNDNITNVYNINRENLYKSDLQQLVASNFIDTINSITQLNGFINPIKYYIIESDSYIEYNLSNIEDIPHIIQFETPVNVEYYSHSLIRNPIIVNKNILKIKKLLINNEIMDISQINYYNNDPISINYNRPDTFNYLDKKDSVYRFNGGYNPIFNEISIFDRIDDNQYNFNVNLDNFGTIKEMIKSKVGDTDTNLLRITGDSYSSIFPQVDEFGYFVDNHNIFKSTWDNKFYKKTIKN